MNPNFFNDAERVRKIVFGIVFFLVVVVAAFVVGVSVGSDNKGTLDTTVFAQNHALPPFGVNFSPVWKAWNTINDKYVPVSSSTPVSSEEKVWGMIEGLANSLGDPYTVFLPPADAEIFAEDISGNFEGVGMEIGKRNDVLTVIAPLKGTPAYRAGIKAGDSILRIDKEPTDTMTVDEAVKRIRGKGGTPVTFTIVREGEDELLEITVVRAVIEIPTIETSLNENNIFIIELYNFSAISPNLFREALREFILSGTDKLLLDLRGNPGGFLEAAVDMASWFLPVGKVVVREDFGRNEKQNIHRSRGYDVFNERLKMVVLINQGSASASEILAGALQEHNIAKLVGEKSFGKGSVQELVDITPDTSLKITIARWLTPNGLSISKGGLTPDIEVSVTAEDTREGIDPQKKRAIELLLSM